MGKANYNRRLAVAAAFVLVAFPGLAQDHGAGHDMSTMSQPMEPESSSANYMAAMKTMDDAMGAMKMTGKPGVDFASMMIPHHQSAIDMAKAYLASGDDDPGLTKLSNDIVASQEAEIAELKGWLEANQSR